MENYTINDLIWAKFKNRVLTTDFHSTKHDGMLKEITGPKHHLKIADSVMGFLKSAQKYVYFLFDKTDSTFFRDSCKNSVTALWSMPKTSGIFSELDIYANKIMSYGVDNKFYRPDEVKYAADLKMTKRLFCKLGL